MRFQNGAAESDRLGAAGGAAYGAVSGVALAQLLRDRPREASLAASLVRPFTHGQHRTQITGGSRILCCRCGTPQPEVREGRASSESDPADGEDKLASPTCVPIQDRRHAITSAAAWTASTHKEDGSDRRFRSAGYRNLRNLRNVRAVRCTRSTLRPEDFAGRPLKSSESSMPRLRSVIQLA
jgi:hypothetical protein